jgi:hypothetical protein
VGPDRVDAYLADVAAAGRPSNFATFSSEEWLLPSLFWLSRAYGQVLAGEATAQEALGSVQEHAAAYWACVASGGDLSRTAWQACARQADPTLPGHLLGTDGQ